MEGKKRRGKKNTRSEEINVFWEREKHGRKGWREKKIKNTGKEVRNEGRT